MSPIDTIKQSNLQQFRGLTGIKLEQSFYKHLLSLDFSTATPDRIPTYSKIQYLPNGPGKEPHFSVKYSTLNYSTKTEKDAIKIETVYIVVKSTKGKSLNMWNSHLPESNKTYLIVTKDNVGFFMGEELLDDADAINRMAKTISDMGLLADTAEQVEKAKQKRNKLGQYWAVVPKIAFTQKSGIKYEDLMKEGIKRGGEPATPKPFYVEGENQPVECDESGRLHAKDTKIGFDKQGNYGQVIPEWDDKRPYSEYLLEVAKKYDTLDEIGHAYCDSRINKIIQKYLSKFDRTDCLLLAQLGYDEERCNTIFDLPKRLQYIKMKLKRDVKTKNSKTLEKEIVKVLTTIDIKS